MSDFETFTYFAPAFSNSAFAKEENISLPSWVISFVLIPSLERLISVAGIPPPSLTSKFSEKTSSPRQGSFGILLNKRSTLVEPAPVINDILTPV